jgi:dTDP-4-amino-4,6-dideoxygalactose transaminase
MNVPFLDLHAQYTAIKAEIDPAIARVIEKSAFAGGPEVTAFEEAFAAYCGTKFCVGMSSGTAALELMLRADGIGEGHEVIVPSHTFFATAEAVSLTGARPVFVDVDPNSGLMNVEQLERATTRKTRAVIPVHLYGQPADMDEVLDFADKHDVIVYEDACQAHGAVYKGKKIGSLARAAAFSFYPGKNLGAYGEGGAVTTDDAELVAKLRMLREHGSVTKYQHVMVGRNDRMDGIQGAVLAVKLKHLDAWNAARKSHAALYKKLLSGDDRIRCIAEMPDRESVYHLFVVRVANCDAVRQKMADKGIGVGIHYPIPLHLQPVYRDLGYRPGELPATEALSQEILSLPMFPELTEAQIASVVEALKAVV